MTTRPCFVALWLGAALTGCGGAKPSPEMPPTSSDPSPTPAADLGPEPLATTDLATVAADGGTTDVDGSMAPPVIPNGSATISGAVNGYTVASAKSVIAVVTPSTFEIYIADRADLCPILQAGASPKSTSFLRFGAVAGMAHTFPAGTYSYPSGSGSGGGMGGGGAGGGGMGTRNAVIAASDDRCFVTGYDQAASGNFTLAAPVDAAAKTVDGTFDITFTVGSINGTMKGKFSAAVCPAATDIPYTPTLCQ